MDICSCMWAFTASPSVSLGHERRGRQLRLQYETWRPQCPSCSQPTPSASGRPNSCNRCAGMAVTPSVLCNTSSRIRSEEQRANGEWCLNMNELIPSVDVLGTDADTCKGGFQFQYRSRRWGRLTVIVLEPGGCCICILPFLIWRVVQIVLCCSSW